MGPTADLSTEIHMPKMAPAVSQIAKVSVRILNSISHTRFKVM